MRNARRPDRSEVDVCVVGGGPAGAVAASELAAAGLSVLLLEAGGRLPRGARLAVLDRDWEPALVPDGAALAPAGRPWTVRRLGGGMSVFAGIGLRQRRVDFDAGGHTVDDALDPRWPIDAADLDPYYDEVEAHLGIARTPGADPLEPPVRSGSLPPHPFSAQGRLLARAGRDLALRPFPTPLLINSVPYAGRPACDACGPCNEYACHNGAKADVVASYLDHPLGEGPDVAVGGIAVRITQAGPDEAEGVEWLDVAAGERRTTRARCVVLAANAVQSAALLLRSASRWAPRGLGNDHDAVGRGLGFKVSGYVAGHVDWPHRAPAAGGPFSTVAFSDHFLDDDAPTGLGGMLYEASPPAASAGAGTLAVRLHFLAADQPMWSNRVRLAGGRDAHGLPRLVLDYAPHPVDLKRLDHLAGHARRILRAAGVADPVPEPSHFARGSSHLHGCCRAGDDPRTSVVDRDGRVHGQRNVFVADGGFFPFSGGVNPTLTIMANSLRVSRGIARTLAHDAPTAGRLP